MRAGCRKASGAAAVLLALLCAALTVYAVKANSVRKPEASGTTVFNGGGVSIDASNTGQGYVMVKYSSSKKIKVQIKKSSGTAYNYDLKADGSYNVFPFSEGSGGYAIGVFENAYGTKYAQLAAQQVDVKLEKDTLPFLYPNQYVWFTSSSKAVKKAAELAGDEKEELEAVKKIYEYVINNVAYDRAKAKSVQSGYLPDVDKILASKKGICFDYAALSCAMLRSLDIPAKLVVGYSGDIYHAWINVYTKEKGWIDKVLYFDGKGWSFMDPTFAAGTADKEYIGEGRDYDPMFVY